MKVPVLGGVWREVRSRWGGLTETQRDHARLLAGLVLLAGLGVAAVHYGAPIYQRWVRDRALAEAKTFAEKKDYRSALVALHRAVNKNPFDREVWSQVANFLSALGSPDVLTARRNQLQLAPDNLAVRLSFVMDALRFGDVAAAREAVAGVQVGAREEVEFFRMAAALAVATGSGPELENALMALAERQPQDRETRVDLASMRLWGPDAGRSEAARQELLALLAEPSVRVRCAVELLKHIGRTGGRNDADRLVATLHERFTGRPPAVGREEAGGQPPGWHGLIEALQREAGEVPQHAAVLARWRGAIGQGREALVWLETLAAEVRTAPLVKAAALDLAMALDDAERMRRGLIDGAWGALRLEAVDLAFAARWQRKLGKPEHARDAWQDAIQASGGTLPGLRALARLGVAWRDTDGALVAMLEVTRRYPTERWAWEALRLEYLRQKDMPRLFALYDRWVNSPLNTRTVEQDWIFLRLMAGEATPSVHARARALRDASPFEPTSVLGHVLSLRAQRRHREALLELDGLSRVHAETERMRLWRGVLLNDLGRRAEARDTLLAVDTNMLLPEEFRLGQEAMNQAVAATRKAEPAPAALPRAP
jgi:tetratricopeptide (TPR) repeat protein